MVVQPKAATSIYCIARANAVAGKEVQQMATIAVPGAANNAATGTWAAMAAGAAMSVAGPATSRICPTAAPKKVSRHSADFICSLLRISERGHALPVHHACMSCLMLRWGVTDGCHHLAASAGCCAHQTAANNEDMC
jgi:hypothetical protein